MAERLPLPIKKLLAERDASESLARARARVLERTLPSPRRTNVRLVGLGFATLLLLAAGFVVGRATSPRLEGSIAGAASLPIDETFADGASHVIGERRAASVFSMGDGTARQTLGDGSEVELAAQSSLRLVEEQPERISLALEHGAARFVVAKRSSRLFRVQAGNVAVLVRGTVFEVVRRGEGAIVQVREGRVDVESGAETHVLMAGQQYSSVGATDETDAGSLADAQAQAVPASPSRRPGAWRALAASGDYPAAYATLGSAGVQQEVATAIDAATLFSLADIARLSGHPREAVTPLRRIVTEHRGDPRASLAAFTLGKLHLDSLGDPRAAAHWFGETAGLGAPTSIAEDARARRVQAFARAGDAASARAAAAEYRLHFPHGRYGAEVTKWAAERP